MLRSPNLSTLLFYFFNGVARQCENALSRAARINQQLDQWRKRVSRTGSSVAVRALDLLATNPFTTMRKTEVQLDVAYNTAATALRRLVRQRIIQQIGKARRDRVFCAQALLNILEEPARSRPE